MHVSRDQLVEDSVFILQCLRQSARGKRQSALDDLEGSVALEPAEYVAFLERFGYLKLEDQSIRVTPQGERAAKGDADVSRDVQDHFQAVLAGGAQTPLASPQVKPVDGELGQGPLSRVRAARLGELGLMVALKEYRPLWESLPWVTRAELSRRVRREAQAQSSLGHPCVLTILEVRGGEEVQVVMPLAASTLRDKLSRSEKMPSWHALRIAAQVAHALSHAHGQGLSHGALKPENVLLDRAGNALLSDFGAARLVALGPSPGPRVQVELGDPRYRAPEVSASEPAGPQGDAFALGALLHEMLAGDSGGALPADLPAPLIELLDELRHPEPAKRPALPTAATRLSKLLAPHPLFAL